MFKKDIVFVVDISGSMQGKLIDDINNALSAALSKLDPDDSFNIIAFNGESYLFSTSMEPASKDTVERATEWINKNFVAEGATNILNPLNTVHILNSFFGILHLKLCVVYRGCRCRLCVLQLLHIIFYNIIE